MAWYDYTFGASFCVPRIYPHRMAANYRFAHGIGVEGITAETCHNWAEAPKYYLMARLQWDPDVDVEATLDEWYRLAVGENAAPHLAAYFRLWEELWSERLMASRAFSRKGQQWLPIQDDSCFDVLRPGDFATSRDLIESTVAEAGSDLERTRAQMLLRGFCFYEAAASARLPDWEAGRSSLMQPADALEQIGAAVHASASAGRSAEIDASLAVDGNAEIVAVTDATRFRKEPGDDMEPGRWRLTVGDDVEPFWNPPGDGRSGTVAYDEDAGRGGKGAIVFHSTGYAMARWRLMPLEGSVVTLSFVRAPVAASARVEARLWPICWTGHNPSPYRVTAFPAAGEWVPLAVAADLRSFPGRRHDYHLLEIVVEGLEEGESLEVCHVATWPLPESAS